MPDRQMRGSAWFAAAHALGALIGLAGIVLDPSPSVLATLRQVGAGWAVVAWSAAFLGGGSLAFVSRVRRLYFTETVGVDIMAGTFLLWAAMTAVAANGSATQAGLGFTLAATFMHGWAVYRRSRLDGNVAFREVMRSAAITEARKGTTA